MVGAASSLVGQYAVAPVEEELQLAVTSLSRLIEYNGLLNALLLQKSQNVRLESFEATSQVFNLVLAILA